MSTEQATCPECGGPFVRDLNDGMVMSTLVAYYGPPGHHHDDNCHTAPYVCASGHRTTLSVRRRCSTPGCDWAGKDECNLCHPGKKLDAWPDVARVVKP